MPDTDPTTPPWGDDFDASKAWSLITNLRADKQRLTDDLSTERQARTDAEKAAKDADPEGKIAAAEKRATDAERALNVAKVIGDFPALKGYEDLLTGDTPDAIKAQAERLASLNVPAKADDSKDGEPADDADASKGGKPTPGQPTPVLTPGHGGDDPEPFDPAAIATAARRL